MNQYKVDIDDMYLSEIDYMVRCINDRNKESQNKS